MATTPEPEQNKRPGTYVVQDRSSELELLRLDEQDRLFTLSMKGVLSEQPDPAAFERVLDVGCGPGWWLIETAKTYPSISRLVGIDVSAHIVKHATNQAIAAGVNNRVTFRTGDASRLLDFPNNYFSLINQRFATSFLRKWDWSKILTEYQRVCKPDGIIRITEASIPEQTGSPAYTKLLNLARKAMYHAGNLFAPEGDEVINHLANKMEQHGIENVQTKSHLLICSAATVQEHLSYIEDMQRGFLAIAPFIRKWTKVREDYDELYQQMVVETQQKDFETHITLTTIWGKKAIYCNML